MGLLATVLTLAVGFGKKGIVNRFRNMLRWINPISAVVLVVVGFYVALYGIWSAQVLDFDRAAPTPWINEIVTWVEAQYARLAGWLNAEVSLLGRSMARTTLMGWAFLAINLGLIAAGLVERLSGGGERTVDDGDRDDGSVDTDADGPVDTGTTGPESVLSDS
jgi:apolipoprotein N-acyltransferase